MKIALCLEYPIGQHGGTEVLVAELIRGLSARHEILLVSPDDAASLAGSPVAGRMAEHISWPAGKFSRARARELAGKISAARPDLIHFHFGGNYAWSNRAFGQCPVVHLRKSGVPVISTNHGAFSILEGYCWNQRPLLIKLALLPPAWLSKQFVLAHLVTEVAVSQNDFHALRRWYPFLRSKFRWIYHSQLQGEPPPLNPQRRPTILCVGTIGTRKGQPLLVEAFARVAGKFPGWQLVFIGRNDNNTVTRQLDELVTRHNLKNQIQLLGARTDEELREWYRQSAIFALPSVYEGLGLSLQEAQFNGCACVATRSGGVADLIEDGDNGFLVPASQPAPLAVALEKLMSDAGLRERFSRRGPQSVLEKGMTADKMVTAYEKVYAEILDASCHAA